MPSSSARCSQLPRAVDKVPFYVALRKLRDYRRGELAHLDESEVTFPDLELKVEPRKDRLDRQLKQQQEEAAAAAAAAAHAKLDKKRRLDGDVDFETMFPGMCSGYPSFQASRSHNGLVPSAGSGASWSPSAWPPSMPPPPPLGFQHPSAAAGSSLVQRLTQVPTMDSMFGAVPLLLKPEDTATGIGQYSQLDAYSSRAGSYWPGPSHHYCGSALANYPYGFHSLYGSSGAAPSVDGQYPGSRTLSSSSSFLYHDSPAVTSSSSSIHTLSSTYPANLHAAAAAAAYDGSPFFLPSHSHSMSSGHIAGSAWPPAPYQYSSSRAANNASYSDPFHRDIPDGLPASVGTGFDLRP